MIKKLLSTFLFATAAFISSYAQCTPNVTCIPAGKNWGICPDSTVGLAKGKVNVPYTETISILVPSSSADLGYPGGTVESIKVTNVTDMAPGLSYTTSPSTGLFPASTSGCILISGTPTQEWNKRIVISYTIKGAYGPSPLSIDRTANQYFCIINAANGIDQLSQSKFDVDQNSPNPFSGKTEIHFNSVSSENIDFKVYNMLGAAVYTANFKADKGINTIVIEANSFAPGVYVYSVGNAAKTITKRMIVSR